MRQITAITVLVLVLLFVIVASRLLDATTISSPVTRQDKAGSGVDSTFSARERLGSGNPPYGRTIEAGGIWFW
jgi:hypothetical protein